MQKKKVFCVEGPPIILCRLMYVADKHSNFQKCFWQYFENYSTSPSSEGKMKEN